MHSITIPFGVCDSRVLVERILRYLASFGMLEEQTEDRYAATRTTRSLSIPGFRAGVEHQYVCPSKRSRLSRLACVSQL